MAKNRTFTIYQHCKSKGIARRSVDNGFDICDDETCHTCKTWRTELHKAMQSVFDALSDSPEFQKALDRELGKLNSE